MKNKFFLLFALCFLLNNNANAQCPTPPAPSGSVFQELCNGATVSALVATGSNISWYDSISGGNALAPSTAIVQGKTYFGSQTVNGCESSSRLAVYALLRKSQIQASSNSICAGQTVTLSVLDSGVNANQVGVFNNNVSNNSEFIYSNLWPTSNFSYDFWFNTTRTITLLTEKSGGVSTAAFNGQNFVIPPGFINQPALRGTGISVGTNGISVIEHGPLFYDARLTRAMSLTGWHHCAVVYQSNAISLYVDGVLVGTKPNGTNFGQQGALYNNVGLIQALGIGYPGQDPNDNYTGKVDELRHWSVPLTANQVNLLYKKKVASVGMAECLLNVSFDQGVVSNSSIHPSAPSTSNVNVASFTSDTMFLDGFIHGDSLGNTSTTAFSSAQSAYLWSTGDTLQTISTSPNQSAAYWVQVTHGNTVCFDSSSISVQSVSVNTATSTTAVCIGGSVTLSVTGANTYTWQPGGLAGASVIVNPAATTIYTVIGTDAGSCTGSATRLITAGLCAPCASDVTLSGTPFDILLTESQTYIATSGPLLVDSNSFVKFDAAAPFYVMLNPGFEAGTGSVFIAQTLNGCIAGAPQMPNGGEGMRSLSGLKNAHELLLYPNPTGGKITVEHPEGIGEFIILDLTGKIVMRHGVDGETRSDIDIGHLQAGVYILHTPGYSNIKIIKSK